MEVLSLKYQLDGIQVLLNRCIDHAYRVLTDRITAQSTYLDRERTRELEQQEYIRAVDELTELYLRYSVLSVIRCCYSDPEFLWESSFFEALKPCEKKKYRIFPIPSFDYSHYEHENTAYDVFLPYFSVVVRAVVLERYAAYLGDRKKNERHTEEKRTADTEFTPKVVPFVAETDNPFDSILTESQIAFLTEAINEVRMFNVPLTSDDLTAILAGKPHAIVRSNNNRLVAFFFSGLSSRGLITPNWQSVIANRKLFLSKNKSRDKYINQSDLSTATNYIRDVGVEGKYATIDEYLKQVKKL